MDPIVTAVTVFIFLTLGYCHGELISQAVLTKNTPTSRTFVCTCSDATSCTADKWEDLLAACRQKMGNFKHKTTSEKAQETSTSAEITTTSTQTPTVTGCYEDNIDRVLPNEFVRHETSMTIELCRVICTQSRYSFYGLEDGAECFCGDTIKSGYRKVSSNQCNTRCTGDPTKTCGGTWRIAIYLVV